MSSQLPSDAPSDLPSGVPSKFSLTYTSLPSEFYTLCSMTPLKESSWCEFNSEFAHQLGLLDKQNTGSIYSENDWLLIFSGQRKIENSPSLAQAYLGHQFGYLNRLGDGRALLLTEFFTPAGQHFDLQLKGSGRTPYSRGGDGRAALGPMLREYLISEFMAAANIPTTRSLAVIKTGEKIFRQNPLDAAILVRIAQSHIRGGTFEYAAHLGPDYVRALTNYTIDRHYPQVKASTSATYSANSAASAVSAVSAAAFLQNVIQHQAELIARWMSIGFIHGVMNTDNMSICGETLDYGPCSFMEAVQFNTVYSSIDHQGRYAYNQQPSIALWNLTRFAETLLPVLHSDPVQAQAIAQEKLSEFSNYFERCYHQILCQKIGFMDVNAEKIKLAHDFLLHLNENKLDLTNSFIDLEKIIYDEYSRFSKDNQDTESLSISESTLTSEDCQSHKNLLTSEERPTSFLKNIPSTWIQKWKSLQATEGRSPADIQSVLHSINPRTVPRNQMVEYVLSEYTENQNPLPFREYLDVLRKPFLFQSGKSSYYKTSSPKFLESYQTFCGT